MLVESERLIFFTIKGTKTEAHSFRREVGIGSNSHCLSRRKFKSSWTFASKAGQRNWIDDLRRGGAWVEEGGESVPEDCEARTD